MRHRYPIFLAALFILGDLCSGQSKPDVSLITTDIETFWRAYDGSQPGSRSEAFQTRYFNQASRALSRSLLFGCDNAMTLSAAVYTG